MESPDYVDDLLSLLPDDILLKILDMACDHRFSIRDYVRYGMISRRFKDLVRKVRSLSYGQRPSGKDKDVLNGLGGTMERWSELESLFLCTKEMEAKHVYGWISSLPNPEKMRYLALVSFASEWRCSVARLCRKLTGLETLIVEGFPLKSAFPEDEEPVLDFGSEAGDDDAEEEEEEEEEESDLLSGNTLQAVDAISTSLRALRIHDIREKDGPRMHRLLAHFPYLRSLCLFFQPCDDVIEIKGLPFLEQAILHVPLDVLRSLYEHDRLCKYIVTAPSLLDLDINNVESLIIDGDPQLEILELRLASSVRCAFEEGLPLISMSDGTTVRKFILHGGGDRRPLAGCPGWTWLKLSKMLNSRQFSCLESLTIDMLSLSRGPQSLLALSQEAGPVHFVRGDILDLLFDPRTAPNFYLLTSTDFLQCICFHRLRRLVIIGESLISFFFAVTGTAQRDYPSAEQEEAIDRIICGSGSGGAVDDGGSAFLRKVMARTVELPYLKDMVVECEGSLLHDIGTRILFIIKWILYSAPRLKRLAIVIPYVHVRGEEEVTFSHEMVQGMEALQRRHPDVLKLSGWDNPDLKEMMEWADDLAGLPQVIASQ